MSLVYAACAPQSQIDLDGKGSGIITDNGNTPIIDDPNIVQPGAGESFAIGGVSQTIKPELNQTLQFNVSVTASASNASAITVNLSTDTSALPSGSVVTATLAQPSVSLDPGETKTASISLKAAVNSASFDTANLKISGANGAETHDLSQAVGVAAVLRITLSSINPYTYDMQFPLGLKTHPSTVIYLQNMSGQNVRFHVNPTQFHAPAGGAPSGAAHMFTVPQNITTISFYDHDRQAGSSALAVTWSANN